MGRATALELASRGAAVVVGARRLAELEKLVSFPTLTVHHVLLLTLCVALQVKEIETAGGKAVAVKFDVTDEKDQVCLELPVNG